MRPYYGQPIEMIGGPRDGDHQSYRGGTSYEFGATNPPGVAADKMIAQLPQPPSPSHSPHPPYSVFPEMLIGRYVLERRSNNTFVYRWKGYYPA